MKVCAKCNKAFPAEMTHCPQDGCPLDDDPLIGQVFLERYEILRLLGRGGMGTVYEGRHLQLGRKVAIKVMQSSALTGESMTFRFMREAKATAMLEHPNAVTIYDFGTIDDKAFIVMEFINGISLREMLNKTGRLTPKQALSLFAPICSVVEAAHKIGIVHRDLKPENVMLKQTEDGSFVVKVVDFGLAKILHADDPKLTQTGQIMGTPYYMSPEMFEGNLSTPSVDIYALGIIFYEMIAGSPPYTGSLEAIIAGHLLKPLPPVRSYVPNLDKRLDEVLEKALCKQPEKRFSSALKLLNELQSVIASSDNLANPILQELVPTKIQLTQTLQKETKPTADNPTVPATVVVPTEPPTRTRRFILAGIASAMGVGIYYISNSLSAEPQKPTVSPATPKIIFQQPPLPETQPTQTQSDQTVKTSPSKPKTNEEVPSKHIASRKSDLREDKRRQKRGKQNDEHLEENFRISIEETLYTKHRKKRKILREMLRKLGKNDD
ncbi:MAG: protein kinase [Acidobacteriota bacterium]|nr:protein kinase [Blastocatellia bacterium]MDW8413152.1 protein kinase [Acidobacteriota bacterium]